MKIGIYVWTSDHQMVALQAWAYLFNKFWDSSLKVTFIGYKLPVFDLPDNFKYISFAGHIEVVIHRSLWTTLILLITTTGFKKWNLLKKIISNKILEHHNKLFKEFN